MDFTDTAALEEAVIVFYRSGTSQHAAAHDWLTKAQRSKQAWSFVWDLMRLDKSSEIQFFGATTLHWKLVKHFQEVPKENYDELKQKLLETIITFGTGPTIVLNRLCISLSAFIVQMIREWPTAIEDITNTLQNEQLPSLSAHTQLWILMEVLCGIPEEGNSIFASVERAALRNYINKRAPFVLRVLEQYLSSKCDLSIDPNDMSTILRAAKCAGFWLKNDAFPLDKCELLSTYLLKLINKCYWNNARSDGCMSADENDLTEACLETLATMMTQPDAHRYSNTALSLMKLFLESLCEITKAEWTENNLNEDIAVGIYTLFISSIECHSRLLLYGVLLESAIHREIYERLIHEILQCTNKPGIYPVEESCSTLAMGFWYMLQDEILSTDDEIQRNKCLQLIVPLYSYLSKILVRKAQYPDESSIDKWSADDLESFRCYRQDIADTLMYCYEVLHEGLLDNLSDVLNESIASIQGDMANWTHLEACIYAFYAIAENIDTSEVTNIPKLMKVLHEIPYETLNDKILGTALETIGAYCEWFKDNPAYLPSVIELLVKGLNSSMASQATLGLKDLCRECQLQMKSFAEPLLKACEQSLLSGKLKNSECVRLMFSIGKIMSMLPAEKILPCLDSMVSPCFAELQEIVQSGSLTESSQIRAIYRLNMISTLFSSLNTKTEGDSTEQQRYDQVQPVLFVMQKTMPIFKNIGELFINEQAIIEALCNALKHAITNLLNDFRPMLPDLCCLIIAIFQSKCVPPALEISKTCIILFYKDELCQNTMRQLLVEVIIYTVRLFQQTHDSNLSDIVDLMEAFWSFNAQIVKKIPVAYSDPNIECKDLLCYANKTVMLPEMSAVKNAIAFLAHFIMQSRNYENMANAVLENGCDIVMTTLKCIISITPRAQTDNFADIFIAFNKKYPAELVVWMRVLVDESLSIPLVNHLEKDQFMKAIIREKVNKRLVQGFIREFSAKCRGLVQKA